ncbi:hypothetical protein CLU79DRAFT_707306 [Phycomyces nitens]|nr:hypothetical protein CLU79DRAFT_707306 [Phycomyces nitens]
MSPINRCLGRLAIPRVQHYSTLPNKTSGPFTPNKLVEPAGDTFANINRTLVYIGPFTETIRRYKTTASLFGICGICAVPALLSTGEAPIMSVIKDKWVGLEKVGLMGLVREQTVRLSDLTDKSTPTAVVWQAKGKTFALERDVMNADPFLTGLVKLIKKNAGSS